MSDNDIMEWFRAADAGPEPAIQRIDVAAAVGSGRRTIRTRWAIGSSMATAALAASVIAVVALSGSSVIGGATNPRNVEAYGGTAAEKGAQVVLLRAAANARKLPAVTPRARQFVYVRKHQAQLLYVPLGPCKKAAPEAGCPASQRAEYMNEEVHELWRPIESGTVACIRITSGGPITPLTPADAAKLEASGEKLDRPVTVSEDQDYNRSCPSTPDSEPNPFLNPTPDTLETLPRDADALLAKVRDSAGDKGPSRDGEALVVIADLLRDADALIEPDLREALFLAASKIPGVSRQPGQANLDGEIGIAIGRLELTDNERQEIIIDPETSRVIGERTVSRAMGGNPNAADVVTSWSATRSYLVNAVKDTTPAA